MLCKAASVGLTRPIISSCCSWLLYPLNHIIMKLTSSLTAFTVVSCLVAPAWARLNDRQMQVFNGTSITGLKLTSAFDIGSGLICPREVEIRPRPREPGSSPSVYPVSGSDLGLDKLQSGIVGYINLEVTTSTNVDQVFYRIDGRTSKVGYLYSSPGQGSTTHSLCDGSSEVCGLPGYGEYTLSLNLVCGDPPVCGERFFPSIATFSINRPSSWNSVGGGWGVGGDWTGGAPSSSSSVASCPDAADPCDGHNCSWGRICQVVNEAPVCMFDRCRWSNPCRRTRNTVCEMVGGKQQCTPAP